jgi:hypothetical protein
VIRRSRAPDSEGAVASGQKKVVDPPPQAK